MLTSDSVEKDGVYAGIFSPITLPCGRVLQNRLVKVAMYEHLASFPGGPPNKHHNLLYSRWSKYDWGMIITGNVQVSATHLSLGRDVVLPERISEVALKPFKDLASSIHGNHTSTTCSNSSNVLAIMQLSHAGRQSANFIGGRYPFQHPSAPSPIRVVAKDAGWLSDILHTLVFQTPRAMSLVDIDDVVEAFVKGALVALQSGFDGVQLHAAHGYLLAQFISPKSNTRTDDYSLQSENALRLLHRIVCNMRQIVPKEFVLGIKINAADYVFCATDDDHHTSATSEQDGPAFNHIRTIADWGLVDFIEISGGDYEKPDFIVATQPSRSPRQALFSRFSRQAMKSLESLPRDSSSAALPLILLTGGLRTPELLHTALSSRHAHLLGIGRGSVLCPELPSLLKQRRDRLSHPEKDWDLPFRPGPVLEPSFYWPLNWLWEWIPRIPLVGAGIDVAWYVVAIRRLAIDALMDGPEPNYSIGGTGALFWMWVWVDGAKVQSLLYIICGILVASALGSLLVSW